MHADYFLLLSHSPSEGKIPIMPTFKPHTKVKANWDDLETILCLVEEGSLAGAATKLGVNYTTVARRVGRAEMAMNMKLFDRLADGYHPTEEAYLVARYAAKMQLHEDDLLIAMRGRDESLSGSLVITGPELIVAHVLPPALKAFREKHPNVELTVKATNKPLNLARREADLAVRVAPDPLSNLMGVKLTAQDTASFATQDWADRIAENPEDTFDWIIYSEHVDLPKGVRETYPNARVGYRFDDMIAMVGAAQAGLGIVRLPMFLGRRATGLVQVPMLAPKPYADIWMLGHRDVWAGAKQAAFRAQVTASIKADHKIFVA
jgi:DNA-binding transcriptional LysR family regulator